MHHLRTLGRDPDITAEFLAQLSKALPGIYQAYPLHSLDTFRQLASKNKAAINMVLLGAAQTDNEVDVAKTIVVEVLGHDMPVLKLSLALLIEEVQDGGILRRFLHEVDSTGR